MAMHTEHITFDPKELTTDSASFDGSKIDSSKFADQHWQSSFSQALGMKTPPPGPGAPYFFFDTEAMWQQGDGTTTGQTIEVMPGVLFPPAANADSPSHGIKMEEADNDINMPPAVGRPVTRRSVQNSSEALSSRKSVTPDKPGRVTKVQSKASTTRAKKSRSSPRKSEEHKEQIQLGERGKEKHASRSKAQQGVLPATAEGDEAQESRQKFLARNRVAASKCRQKKKEFVETLQDEAKRLEEDNGKLQETWRCLLAERTLLKNSVMAHGHCGDPNINGWVKAEAERIVRAQPNEDTLASGSGEIAAALSETTIGRRVSLAQSSPESAAQLSTTSSSLPPLVHSSPDSPELAALINVSSPAFFNQSPEPELDSSTDFMSATLTSLISMDSPVVKDDPDAFNYDYMPQSMFEESLPSVDCQS